MKLKSFKIQSYRSCIKTELTLNEELTCLIGINGAGKSNILNAILLLRKLSLNRQGPYRSKDDNYNKCKIEVEFLHEEKLLYMKGDIVFDSDEHNSDYIQSYDLQWNFKNFIDYSKWFSLPIESFIDINFIDLHMSNLIIFEDNQKRTMISNKNRKFSFQIPNEINKESIEIIIKIINAAFTFFNDINYYSASIFSDPSKCPASIEFEDNRPQRRFRSFLGHDKFIIDLYNLFKEKGIGFKRYFEIVNKSGIGLVDDIFFNEIPLPSSTYEIKSADKIKMKDYNRLVSIPNFTIDGINLSPNQLSEGTFRTLALIFYILNDDSKLLLIEEPEVCVHHGLLSSIIELIITQSKNKQIIISTHSDFVLDHLKPENIILVKRQENNGTTAQLLSKSMSKNDYKVLRSFLEESGNLGEYWRAGGFDNE